jgi:hypothetical protein
MLAGVAGNKINTTLVKGIVLMLFTCLYLYLPAHNDSIRPAVAETVPQTVDFRIPDEGKLKEYQEDPRFRYKREEMTLSWWEKVQYWLADFLRRMFSKIAETGVFGYIIIIAVLVLICLFVLKLLGVDIRTAFGKKRVDTPEIAIYTENVHNMDFDSLIAAAFRNKDYRLVVRFLYLKNLKLLTDREIIEWKANTTNYSYLHEIENPDMRSRFMETTVLFDYVWYGEFMPDEANFSAIYDRMNAFSKMVANER